MNLKGERIYKKLPNVSKSLVKNYKFFCDYLFYNKYILKEKEKELGFKADVGTDTHLVFTEFWDKVDFLYIFELEIEQTCNINDSPITLYFYSVCMTTIPECDRKVGVFQRIFWKFAILQASRFLYFYRLFNGNKKRIAKYFFPLETESFYYSKKYGIYGTKDVVFKDVDGNLYEVVYVADYKTGNVPASVMKGPKNPHDETSIELPTKFMFESHFYGLLFLLEKGWDFHDNKIVEFILNDKWQDNNGNWHEFGLGRTKEEQQKIDKQKKRYLASVGARLKRYNKQTTRWEVVEHGEITVGIIFLSGNPLINTPVIAKKKFHQLSLTSTLVRINEMKVIDRNLKNDQFYIIKKMKTRPKYNKYRCENCSRNAKCLKEIEEEMKNYAR